MDAESDVSLVFCDIQLADGLSFEIFEHVKVSTPVIFTTAYDEYAIQAFKTNSVDYILKPIDIDELELAIEKFERFFQKETGKASKVKDFSAILESIAVKNYRNRYLIKVGEKLHSILSDDIAYFFSEDKSNYIARYDGKTFIIDKSMDQIFAELNPERFFRINRSCILAMEAIKDIIQFSNSRLKVRLTDGREEIVSRERVQEFKSWLDQ